MLLTCRPLVRFVTYATSSGLTQCAQRWDMRRLRLRRPPDDSAARLEGCALVCAASPSILNARGIERWMANRLRRTAVFE
jgi:hypothetical protein